MSKHAGESRPAERGRRGRAAAVALGAALLLGWPGLVRAQSSDTLYREALEARRKGDFAAAIRLLREALRLEPKNADALLLLGTVHGFQNRFGEAEAILREALALAPDYADAKLALARVLAWQERYGEATALTDEVVAKGPPRPDAYELAGRIAYYRGDLDLAGERFRRALDIRPTTLDALVGLGDVAEARGDSREARRWWEQARAAAPDSQDVQRRLAREVEPGRLPWRLDLAGSHSALERTDLGDWREGHGQLTWLPSPGESLYGRVEVSHRFAAVDVYGEVGGSRRVSDRVEVRGALGGAPAANFRERYALGAGTTVRLSGPGGPTGPLLGDLDARFAQYPGARVVRVVPGLEYRLLDGRLGLSASLPTTFGVASTDTGWRVKADAAPASLPVSLGIGYADVPETVNGETRTTRAIFGYVRWQVGPAHELRLDLADEDRQNSYRRLSATLNLTLRF